MRTGLYKLIVGTAESSFQREFEGWRVWVVYLHILSLLAFVLVVYVWGGAGEVFLGSN